MCFIYREERLKNWDVFREDPQDGGSEEHNESFYNSCYKFFKVISILGIFILVSGATFISKGTLLYAAANARQNIPMSCVNYTSANVTLNLNLTKCVVLPVSAPVVPTTDPNISSVSTSFSCLLPDDVDFWVVDTTLPVTVTCTSVSVRWLWTLLLIMCTPYFFVFIRCMWLVCFKSKVTPTMDILLVVSILWWVISWWNNSIDNDNDNDNILLGHRHTN